MRNIAIIGADSTHVYAFVRLMETNKERYGEISAQTVFVDRSSKMRLSQKRIAKILEQLSSYEHLNIVEDINQISGFDGYLILSVDAGFHLDHYRRLYQEGVPVFIDKPIAYKIGEAKKIYELASCKGSIVMSSSALRFAPFVLKAKEVMKENPCHIIIRGPLFFEEEVPGYYWYGIHLVEILETLCGEKPEGLSWQKVEEKEIISGMIQGIPFTIEGYLDDSENYSVSMKTLEGEKVYRIEEDGAPLYSYLLDEILHFIKTGLPPLRSESTLSILEVLDEIHQVKKKSIE